MTSVGGRVQIEFTPDNWTDVTADFEDAIRLHYGRTSQFSDVTTATCTLTLANDAGQYSPHSQASPYWPNILPGKRIRISAIPPSEGVGTNLMLNPGGSATLTGWRTLTGGTTLSADASRSWITPVTWRTVHTTTAEDGPTNHVANNMAAVAPGAQYVATAWVFHEAPTARQARLRLVFQSVDDVTLVQDVEGAYVTVPPDTWTRLTVTATSPAGSAWAYLQGRLAATAGDVAWWNGWQLELGSAPTSYISGDFDSGYSWLTPANIAFNPSFESNVSSWTVIATGGTATLTRDTTQSYVGAASAKLAVTSAGVSEAYARSTLGASGIPVVANQAYGLSAWIRPAQAGTYHLRAQWYGAGGVALSAADGPIGTGFASNTWARLVFVTQAPANAAYVSIHVRAVSPANGDILWIDAVRLEAGFCVTPYAPAAWNTVSGRPATLPDRPRFTGYIRSWAPVEQSIRPLMQIMATCRLDRMSRFQMLDAITSEMLLDGPAALWPLTEPNGSTSVSDIVGGLTLTVTPLGPWSIGQTSGPSGLGTALTFGGVGTPRTYFSVDRANSVSALIRGTVYLPGNYYAVGIWMRFAANPSVKTPAASFDSPSVGGSLELGVTTDGRFYGGAASSGIITDGGWHYVFVVMANGSPYATHTLYIDGVYVQTATTDIGFLHNPAFVIGDNVDIVGEFNSGGSIDASRLAVYAVAPTADRIAAHAAMGNPATTLTAAALFAKIMAYGGIPITDYYTTDGATVCSMPDTTGLSLDAAGRQVALSESGGAIVWANPGGEIRFAGKTARKAGAPALTIDAGDDLDARVAFSPTLNLDAVRNVVRVTALRAPTQVLSDAASQGEYGASVHEASVLCSAASDVARVAQWALAAQREPAVRLTRVSLDLRTCSDPVMRAMLAAKTESSTLTPRVEIGSRVRLLNLPSTQPRAQLDLIVEGWTETIATSGWVVDIDTSPADQPAGGLWGAPTAGRWQPAAGSLTLASPIISTGTTLSVASSGLTLTVAAAAYPLRITVDEEDMMITSPPGGTTTPQSLTVIRGVNGSRPASHLAGAVVSLTSNTRWCV